MTLQEVASEINSKAQVLVAGSLKRGEGAGCVLVRVEEGQDVCWALFVQQRRVTVADVESAFRSRLRREHRFKQYAVGQISVRSVDEEGREAAAPLLWLNFTQLRGGLRPAELIKDEFKRKVFLEVLRGNYSVPPDQAVNGRATQSVRSIGDMCCTVGDRADEEADEGEAERKTALLELNQELAALVGALRGLTQELMSSPNEDVKALAPVIRAQTTPLLQELGAAVKSGKHNDLTRAAGSLQSYLKAEEGKALAQAVELESLLRRLARYLELGR